MPHDEPEPAKPSLDDLLGPDEPDPWGLRGTPEPEVELRRLHPARDDKLPVYVQDQGGRVSLSGDRLVITGREEGRAEARLANTSQVALLGNVQITTQALRALLSRGIPLSFFTTGGWFLGRATGHESNNVELRLAQMRAATSPETCLRLARGFVVSKIKNARTMLRRNAAEPDATALSELEQLARKAEDADSLGSLLGLEGTAARIYFGQFGSMLKRLRKVFKTMLGYGDHLQLSVFRCELSAREMVELRCALEAIIHKTEDQVLFVDVGPADGRVVFPTK